MEGNFKYTIEGKERKFFVGMYAVEKTLEEMGASLSDLSSLFSFQYFKLLRNMMYYSAEYVCIREDKEVDFKPTDVYAWIDSTGGAGGEFISQFIGVMMPAMGVRPTEEESEKKNQQKAVES